MLDCNDLIKGKFIQELSRTDKTNGTRRRYRYWFTYCKNCGPKYQRSF
ncbi:MAG: hypothetical protein ACW97Z_02795 [Candidatus Hodarchaeales archaeon]